MEQLISFFVSRVTDKTCNGHLINYRNSLLHFIILSHTFSPHSHTLTAAVSCSSSMIVVDVFIWVLLPFLNFLYWLDVGEKAFISSHLHSCHTAAIPAASLTDIDAAASPVKQHVDAGSGAASSSLSAAAGEWSDALTHVPPHFTSLPARPFQKHRGNDTDAH
jgi:hypothetical protein